MSLSASGCFFPVLQVMHICIISENMPLPFFLLILTITGSDFNIEYLNTNIAMTTQMQKNLKNEGIMIAK